MQWCPSPNNVFGVDFILTEYYLQTIYNLESNNITFFKASCHPTYTKQQGG